MRYSVYALASTVLTSGLLLYAYATRMQFYPAVIFLVKSNFSKAVLINMAIALSLFFGKVTSRLFLGRLRESEVELVWENTAYAIPETCLALTIFRDQLNPSVVGLFTTLLFCKIFHWLADARVEHIEQSQETSRLTHVRVSFLMIVLLVIDLIFTFISAHIVSKHGATVQLLFGFEYSLLTIAIVTTAVRYTLTVIETYLVQGRWYNKSLYELYLKLIMEMLKLVVYFIFFAIVSTFHGMPVHLLRQLYLSFKSVNERLRHYLLFRRVTANLNERFANATEEELEATDKICIICREEMTAGEGVGAPKRLLPCGHIFHFYCLRNWFERQLKCPTCRADILPSSTSTTHENANDNQNGVQDVNNNEALRLEQEGVVENRNDAAAPARERRRDLLVPQNDVSGDGAVDNLVTESGAPVSQDDQDADERNERLRHHIAGGAFGLRVNVVRSDQVGSNLHEASATNANGSATTPSGTMTGSDGMSFEHGTTQASNPATFTPSATLRPDGAGQNSSQHSPFSLPFLNVGEAARTQNYRGIPAAFQAHPLSHQTVPQLVPSVTHHIQSQIELLQLQLQVYAAQIEAANATKEAAQAALEARGFIVAQSSRETDSGHNSRSSVDGDRGDEKAQLPSENDDTKYGKLRHRPHKPQE